MAVTTTRMLWQRTGLRVSLTQTISGAGATAFEFELRDTSGFAGWPRIGKDLKKWGHSANGYPIAPAANFTLGRAEPAVTVTMPFTALAYAILASSLRQNNTYSSTKHVLTGPYTAPILSTPLYLHLEAGITGEKAVFQGVGGLVRSLTIDLPPVGPDLGEPMLTAEISFANATTLDAFSLASVTTTDSDVPFQSDDFTFALDTNTKNFVKATASITNNGVKHPNVASTPTAWLLGGLDISGSVTVALTGDTSDEYDLLQTAYEAKTVKEVKWTSGAPACLFSADVLLGKPSDENQDDIVLVTFPYQGVFVDTNQPVFEATIGDLLWD